MSYAQVYINAIGKKQERKQAEPKKCYSEILGEHYTVYPSGDIIFNSGMRYSKAEIALIKDLEKEAIQTIHLMKNMFDGEVIQCG